MNLFSEVCLQQYDLERHSRSHRGEKPYKCYVCGRPFAMSHHLNNHMVTHTGVRAYSCLVCSKRFAQTFSLKRHMRMHLRAAESVSADGSTSANGALSADGGRTFSVGGMALLQSLSCNVCGKIFGSQQTLKRHRCATGACGRRTLPSSAVLFVSQMPHRCHDCGLEFSTARELNEHAASVHAGRPKKPYTCSDCDKSFSHPYSLKRHRVEHGGDAHVCPTCGKRFAQLYELSRHLKSHHVGQQLSTGLPPTASNHECRDNSTVHPSVSTQALPSESPSCFSMQIAKYMALQDTQTNLASHLLIRERHLTKPGDVGLLAFAQSLVVTAAPAIPTPAQSVTVISTVTE